MQYKGIDVSSWQENINWEDVQNNNINFAIVRATYGTTGTDEFFSTNMEGISKTSIHPGAYHYSYAKSLSEAKEEAQHFLNVIKPYSFSYPVAFDIEDSSLEYLGVQTLTDITREFCQTIQNNGYYVCIFSSINWLNNYLDMNALSNFDVWLSQWDSSPSYSGNFGIWQYTSSGTVSGINGDVDMDISYRNYPEIISNAGLNNGSGSSGGNVTYYTVIPGDSLWSIAERFLGSGYKYNKIVVLNGLTSDVIYPGQVLKIPSSGSTINYTVVEGDTLWSIAKKFLGAGTKYGLIMTANDLTSDLIYPGQVLKIPQDN